jgi:hypothetical protein
LPKPHDLELEQILLFFGKKDWGIIFSVNLTKFFFEFFSKFVISPNERGTKQNKTKLCP